MLPDDTPLKPHLIRIGKRIKDARRDLKLTGKQVAERVGVSHSMLNHWELGRAQLTILQAAKLASVLNTTVDALLGGVRVTRAQGQVAVAMRLPRGRMVPRATIDEILNIARGRLDYEDIDDKRAVYTPCSDESLIFEQSDRSMEPSIPEGTQVVFDRQRLPKPGDHVLVALLATNEVLSRRYRPGPDPKVGTVEAPFTLRPENDDLEPTPVTKTLRPVFLGTRVEYSRTGSR